MDIGRVNSLKRRLMGRHGGQLNLVVDELLREDEPIPAELLQVIISSYVAGNQIIDLSLAKLIVNTKDKYLYLEAAKRGSFFHSDEALCCLMKGRIPDRAIEEKLSLMLASRYEKGPGQLRKEILRTFRDFGTRLSLETLEQIRYDYSASVLLADNVVQAMSDKGGLTLSEKMELTNAQNVLQVSTILKEAINQIKLRNEKPSNDWGSSHCEGTASDELFSRALAHREKAVGHIEHGDFYASLNWLRKALEALLKTTIELLNIPREKKEPIAKLELPTLLAIVHSYFKKDMDPHITKYLGQLQDNTTYGSHDQGDKPPMSISKVMAEAEVHKFDQVHKYFTGLAESALQVKTEKGSG